MVTRCGFFIEDGAVRRKDVCIDWELGFDKPAKHEYIRRIREALGEGLQPSIDVTTASPDWTARGLSPFYVYSGELSVEDAWANVKVQNPIVRRVPGAFDYLYLNALSEGQLEYVLSRRCFIDVFHNPEKAYNTQAKSLAVYQLLHYQGKLHLLQDFPAFSAWYMDYCMDIEVL